MRQYPLRYPNITRMIIARSRFLSFFQNLKSSNVLGTIESANSSQVILYVNICQLPYALTIFAMSNY